MPDAFHIEDQSPNLKVIQLQADVTGAAASRLFECLTKPELLTRWWPQEAQVDGREGGAYRLSWPGMGWVLTGRYTVFVPGRTLAFTWSWDQEPDRPTRNVIIQLADSSEGTRMTLTHGDYTSSEDDQGERRGHIEGWLHFLLRLATVATEDGE